MSPREQNHYSGKSGLHFVLLFGAVNLFADMTYEAARSVTGSFLATLGASAFVVGSVTGFGEFLGYALRLASGRVAGQRGELLENSALTHGREVVTLQLGAGHMQAQPHSLYCSGLTPENSRKSRIRCGWSKYPHVHASCAQSGVHWGCSAVNAC